MAIWARPVEGLGHGQHRQHRAQHRTRRRPGVAGRCRVPSPGRRLRRGRRRHRPDAPPPGVGSDARGGLRRPHRSADLAQRAWAAVLVHAPAALAGASALRAHGISDSSPPRSREPVEVVVARSRRVDAATGVTVGQVADFDDIAQLHLSPPRVRVEHAALTVASRARTDDAAVAALAEVVRQGRTTTSRLRTALAGRARLRHAALLREVLAEVEAGAWSPLERRYLRDVGRAHALPRGRRQVPAEGARGRVYRDVSYDDHEALVELDGRLGHEATRDRWADLERDLHAPADGLVTLRAGWGQVLDPCRLARVVGAVLQLRGWAGTPRSCGPGCAVDQASAASPSSNRSTSASVE